ncbi:MAG TPA: hypothetical protein VK674_07115 [Candidatus Limnocylindria bacterium]|nr:hypothetical protein [Candidatus Limnocylindria bacterium]
MARKRSPQPPIVQLALIHFLLILLFAGTIVVHDASQLIAPAAVLQRWKLTAAMTVLVTAVWYFARIKQDSSAFQKWLIAALVFGDIIFTSLLVYSDRGMASPAVALYSLPIAVSAALRSRSALWATAVLSATGYSLAAIKYFVDYFNEGYKVQLYATIGLYGTALFLLVLLLTVALHTKADT